MWNVNAKVISVIVGVIETISHSLRQYLKNISREHEIREVKKNKAVFGTAHIQVC